MEKQEKSWESKRSHGEARKVSGNLNVSCETLISRGKARGFIGMLEDTWR